MDGSTSITIQVSGVSGLGGPEELHSIQQCSCKFRKKQGQSMPSGQISVVHLQWQVFFGGQAEVSECMHPILQNSYVSIFYLT